MSQENTKSKDILGVLVGGGPAPGINGVISAVTIEAINQGKEVKGILDGYKWLAKGDNSHTVPLTIEDVSRIHSDGGSVIRTSRHNPLKEPGEIATVVKTLLELDVKYLVTIGGDDTAYAASRIEREAFGRIKVAHVPKTIDNDLPLPAYVSTFGFQTARHVGVELAQSLMEDAKTTNRWYVLVSMGRKSGHLALGIATAAGATLAVIAEEFHKPVIPIHEVCDVLEGAIIKRLAMGRQYGVAVLAEGLIEHFSTEELGELNDVELDDYGNPRLSEIQLGRLIKNIVKDSLASRDISMRLVAKDIGYELRCAQPIPFDIDYTRNLGYGAIKFLMGGNSGAIVSIQAGRLVPIYFDEIIDPVTGKTRVRMVDINTESYEVARKYMIRLEEEDFQDPSKVKSFADAGRMTEEAFVDRFGYMAKR